MKRVALIGLIALALLLSGCVEQTSVGEGTPSGTGTAGTATNGETGGQQGETCSNAEYSAEYLKYKPAYSKLNGYMLYMMSDEKLNRVLKEQGASEALKQISDLTCLNYLNMHRLESAPEKDLSLLSNFTNLHDLTLSSSWSDLVPIDFSPLSSLTQLRRLYASFPEGSNISAIGKLTNLETLSIQTGISDLTLLQNLENLEDLEIKTINSRGRLEIQDFTPLQNLKKLKSLTLIYIDFPKDISPIAKIPNLERLDIEGSSILDLSQLKDSKSLKRIQIMFTPVSNSSSLKEMTQLETLEISGTFIHENTFSKEECDELKEALPDTSVICFGAS
jgi:hypothetical protein